MKKSMAGISVVLLLAANGALAQNWPSRSIRLVVPWAAGGPPDAVGRLLSQRVGDAFKQQIVVDNRPGANSIIGTEMVARAAPDGYTYLLTTGSHTTNAALHPKLPYDTLKDFFPLTMIGESAGMVIGVHPSLPVKSVKDLVALAKSRPGQLTFGSAGNGNTLHLAGELFKAATGVNLTHVPFKSAAPALNDLLGGHIDMMFASPISLAPPIKAGRLRGIAQMGKHRSHLLPELVTLNELGIRDAEIGGWYGLYAPAKTPREVIDRMLAEVLKALKEPEVREKIGNLGAEPVGMPSDEFARFIVADIDKYARLGKRINLKLGD
ncbi:MAG: tripartite tricarboxylate transporter substrate binding protein [Betaproteobacteria bacterium]|jgi:tripartite-type tricarboxylate transporter receptor subunit TctC|nr:tripartite tricarboxylate transporter substrate binding protein [Betaproteobacteria bacterium]